MNCIVFNGAYLFVAKKKNSVDLRGIFAQIIPHVVLETNILMVKDERKSFMAGTKSEIPTYMILT